MPLAAQRNDAQANFPCLELADHSNIKRNSCLAALAGEINLHRPESLLVTPTNPTLFSFGEQEPPSYETKFRGFGSTSNSSPSLLLSESLHQTLRTTYAMHEKHHKGINGIVLLFILVLLASQKSASVRPAIARIFQYKPKLLCVETRAWSRRINDVRFRSNVVSPAKKPESHSTTPSRGSRY
jgi:hypothetical protein